MGQRQIKMQWGRVALCAMGLAFYAAAVPIVSRGEEAGSRTPQGPMLTRWGKALDIQNVLPEYPRPQMVRRQWLNLNGPWQFAPAQEQEAAPLGRELPRAIVVPFPVESVLSGVGEKHERIWYRRTFEAPAAWQGQRVMLHFGAVDWETRLWVNGQELKSHRGGYDAFVRDITDALKPEGPQELVVGVFDPTNAGSQPAGKQVNKPEGIWYTSSTGIWQTVWLEPVPPTSIEKLVLTPDVDQELIHIETTLAGPSDQVSVEAIVRDGAQEVARVSGPAGTTLNVPLPKAKLWSPSSPHLYDVRVSIHAGDRTLDAVESYFGMRKIEAKLVDGQVRMLLNGEDLFQVGPLDQGFWPDGLYTAPSDEALKWDLELTQKLGFNATRKHVKVEPQRWYTWCDRMGLLVWQDMPHAMKAKKTPEVFEGELKSMIDGLWNHPSIVMWVVFNEGWGQYDTPRITEAVMKQDPHRLVSNASGWTDFPVGHVVDLHKYPAPGIPKADGKRVRVLGEFGGLGLMAEGHAWQGRTWSYRGTLDSDHLALGYLGLLDETWRLRREEGLAAAIYTQLTDVEGEINGLASYDREVVKVDAAKIAAFNRGEFPQREVLVATSEQTPATWRFTHERPSDDWVATSYDDSAWREGPGGFGKEGTPGAVVRTQWETPQIWLRREFDLANNVAKGAHVALRVHHDEDVEVYVNGVLAVRCPGYTAEYQLLPIRAEAQRVLQAGKNTLAVYCKQSSGGQYVDVGLVELK
jgi:hypothetical protein